MIGKKRYLFIILTAVFLFGACHQETNSKEIKTAVLNVLNKSATDWNSGSVEAYMQCYLHSDSLQFDGNGSTTYGWQQSLSRYKKAYPDKKAMGRLQFSNIKIRILSPTAAFVSGKWELTKESSHPEGLFTLLFRKTEAGWHIVYDHSSSKVQ